MHKLFPLILMLHVILNIIRVSVCKGPSSGNQNQSFVRSGHGIKESDGYNRGISL